MTNFILKFGKYKGQYFLSTPPSYQDWLLKQKWFKVPSEHTAERKFSNLCSQLRGWDGFSQRGAAIYDAIFEAEKEMDDAVFNSSDPHSPFWNGNM